jgi:hypothetical protein
MGERDVARAAKLRMAEILVDGIAMVRRALPLRSFPERSGQALPPPSRKPAALDDDTWLMRRLILPMLCVDHRDRISMFRLALPLGSVSPTTVRQTTVPHDGILVYSPSNPNHPSHRRHYHRRHPLDHSLLRGVLRRGQMRDAFGRGRSASGNPNRCNN